MRIAFITRSTLYQVYGGDTIQILETAGQLREAGIHVSIYLSHEKIAYDDFDLLHFFNITRPADILYHVQKTDKPFVVTPILIDYSEYDQKHRKGFSGWLLRSFASTEYIKTISRWLLLKDRLPAKNYLWKGQKKSIRYILEKATMILPNSMAESIALEKQYPIKKPYVIIPNGINEKLFSADGAVLKDENLVICAARIEGIKNQMNLIKAVNNSSFTLLLIGEPANQKNYYKKCKRLAGKNIVFTGRLTQKELIHYYQKAKVHVLPSWFETCGLSSLEAAAIGCNIVITDKGFASDYFGEDAFYCDPENPESIYKAILLASRSNVCEKLKEKISKEFTWKQAAQKTLEAYHSVLSPNKKFISVDES